MQLRQRLSEPTSQKDSCTRCSQYHDTNSRCNVPEEIPEHILCTTVDHHTDQADCGYHKRQVCEEETPEHQESELGGKSLDEINMTGSASAPVSAATAVVLVYERRVYYPGGMGEEQVKALGA
jgi:hypothetical protein